MIYDLLAEALRAARPVALATVVGAPPDAAHIPGEKVLVGPEGALASTMSDPDLERVVVRDAVAELLAGRSDMRHYGRHGEAGEDAVEVFVESFAPPPRLLAIGAMDFTGALVRVAKVLGYRVTVCDAREVFATTHRFPQADEVVVRWPHELIEEIGDQLGAADAVCVLTHDVRFDLPALLAALGTRAGYIGAMGSRRTHAARLVRLREAGATEEDLARICAPIGLDLGAATPEETAISICAEIIARRTGRSAGALSTTSGPIH